MIHVCLTVCLFAAATRGEGCHSKPRDEGPVCRFASWRGRCLIIYCILPNIYYRATILKYGLRLQNKDLKYHTNNYYFKRDFSTLTMT